MRGERRLRNHVMGRSTCDCSLLRVHIKLRPPWPDLKGFKGSEIFLPRTQVTGEISRFEGEQTRKCGDLPRQRQSCSMSIDAPTGNCGMKLPLGGFSLDFEETSVKCELPLA